MRLGTRLGGIAILLFMVIFFDFSEGGFKWHILTGVCEEIYVDGNFTCGEGSISIPVLKTELFFDPISLFVIWVITFLVVYSKSGDRIELWEDASHVVKDVGELGAAMTALFIFFGQFNERMISTAFGVAFLCYFYGHATSIFIKTYVKHHLKNKEQDMEEATIQKSV